MNEVNVLAKMYCPEKQSLLHASVNRMIETQISIGNELALEQGVAAGDGGKKRRHDPSSALVGLDQEAQLAIILLDQRRRNRRGRNRDDSSDESDEEETGEEVSIKTPPIATAPGGGLFSAAVRSSQQSSAATSPVHSPKKTGPIPPTAPLGGPKKIKYTIKIGSIGSSRKAAVATGEDQPMETGPAKVNASTQTVRDPTIEPGVRIYRLL